ncbi:response regulator transcription factor [Actinoplanes sp. NEAU-A12]|uniref:Response regulator transcription factor n=1 Tax=Actinoplanes sandaracinus TaxID=3045177 RepID=A0ABT6WI81_9ACTN|nr:response regulator transcription factor [Actinoplanes sandaracinus]MDI6099380.1 response regulator transcription factor [Actinoplanes sandaracinus]
MTGPALESITVCLADDHTLMRDGIREMLSTEPEFRVVGEAPSGHDAIALVARLRPDVLLLDVEMPGPGPVAVIRQVRAMAPTTRVVVLTMHDDAEMVHQLLDAGAVAYLLKTILREELIAAVRSVVRRPAQNNILLAVSRETVQQLDRQKARSEGTPLTARELEVLVCIAEAMSNAQIANRLFITEATVKRHLTNIYAKLQAVSRVDAIRKATAARLIKPAGEQPPYSAPA